MPNNQVQQQGRRKEVNERSHERFEGA